MVVNFKSPSSLLFWRCDANHPSDAEAVFEHAEARGKEGFG
jgi:hypothetical protein